MTEAQKCLYHIAENMRMDKSISKEGYEYFQQAIKALEQEPTTKNDCAQERYQDLIEHFGDEKVAKTILESRKEFKTWLERLKWNVKRVDELGRELEQIKGTTKNDLGVDWERYKDVDGNSLDDLILEVLQNNFDCGNTYGYKVADEIIGLLPSVTPQEPKTGHWISTETKGVRYAFWCRYKCSLCGGLSDRTNFCPNCGCRMVEPQESESE